jgi:hypothetical protein
MAKHFIHMLDGQAAIFDGEQLVSLRERKRIKLSELLRPSLDAIRREQRLDIDYSCQRGWAASIREYITVTGEDNA